MKENNTEKSGRGQRPDFSEEVKINKFFLDKECERHVSLCDYYTNQQALTKAKLNELQEKLKLVSSELERSFRKKWDEKIDGKQTEGAIRNKIDASEKICELNKNIQEVQRELYILDAAVKTIDHRKGMLDNLVTLWVKGYYSAPNGKLSDRDSEKSRSLRPKA